MDCRLLIYTWSWKYHKIEFTEVPRHTDLSSNSVSAFDIFLKDIDIERKTTKLFKVEWDRPSIQISILVLD